MSNKRRFMQQGSSDWTSEISPYDEDVKGTISGKTRFGTNAEERKYFIEDAQEEASERFKTGAGIVKDVASFTPAGDVVDVADMYNAYKNGDNTGMILASLGFIPFIGNAAKKTGKTLKRFVNNAKDEIDYRKSKFIDELDFRKDVLKDNIEDIKEVLKYKASKAIDDFSYNEKTSKYAKWIDDNILGKINFVDDDVIEFFENDVIPRIKKFDLSLSSEKPITKKDFKYKYSLTGVNKDSNGVYRVNSDEILLRPFSNKQTKVHEISHRLQYIDKNKPWTYTNMAFEKLNNAYRLPTNTEILTKNAGDILEKEAFNRSIRFGIYNELKNKLGRIPTIEEVDEYIDNPRNENLLLHKMKIDAYGDEYNKSINEQTYFRNAAINAYRDALKYVPVVGGAAIIHNKQNNDSNNMKNGGKVKKRFDNSEKRFLNLISEVSLR